MSNFTTRTIYCIRCVPTSQVYVGQTSSFKKRKVGHLSQLRLGKHYNQALQNAFNQYGEDAFEFIVIETKVWWERAIAREEYWIMFLSSRVGVFNNVGRDKPPAENKNPTALVHVHNHKRRRGNISRQVLDRALEYDLLDWSPDSD